MELLRVASSPAVFHQKLPIKIVSLLLIFYLSELIMTVATEQMEGRKEGRTAGGTNETDRMRMGRSSCPYLGDYGLYRFLSYSAEILL